jgi:hypothetical protein
MPSYAGIQYSVCITTSLEVHIYCTYTYTDLPPPPAIFPAKKVAPPPPCRPICAAVGGGVGERGHLCPMHLWGRLSIGHTASRHTASH